jgi:hypothetical protein
MKTLFLSVVNTEQEARLLRLAKELGIKVTEAQGPLSTRDVVLGIGRPFTSEELGAYMAHTSDSDTESLPVAKVRQNIRARLGGQG